MLLHNLFNILLFLVHDLLKTCSNFLWKSLFTAAPKSIMFFQFRFHGWSAFFLLFPWIPITAIFMAIIYQFMTAIMAILTILAIMAWLNMVLNMVIIGVYGKIRERADHESGINKLQQFKSYGQTKTYTKIRVIFLCILAQNFNKLERLLRMFGFVSNLF